MTHRDPGDQGDEYGVRFVVFVLACMVLGVPVVIGLVTQGLLIRIAKWADR